MTRYTHDGGVKTLEEMEETIRVNVLGDYAQHGYGRFAVVYKETGQFIGFSGLKYLPNLDEVDIGYRLAVPFWGKGLATESVEAVLKFGFETLKLKKIVGLAIPENTASVRVMEKMGFRFEKEIEEDGVMAYQYCLERTE